MQTIPADSSFRVLMVEDDSPLRALNKILLSETGRFQVVGEAEDGLEAIAVAASVHPDVVLLDLAMPVMGGMEALPKIKNASPRAKIVILSMLQQEGIERDAISLGATGFIDKGLDSEQFVKRLVAILEGSPIAPSGDGRSIREVPT